MCHFITLIVPSDDQPAIAEVMKRHGRAATPIANASVASVLLPGEHQYLTTAGRCDCGTILVGRQSPAEREEALMHEAERLRRKRWSPAKIARAIEGGRKAGQRRDENPKNDSLALWSDILADLLTSLPVRHVALFVHFYSGGIDDEHCAATRVAVPKNMPIVEALGALQEDQITVFGKAA